MSGFAYRISLSTPVEYTNPNNDEAAGKVGKVLGVIAAIVVPFAAPAVFGAIAGSGILGSGLAAAAASGTIGTLTSVLGSAAVGGIMNAGIAYANGARGGDVWRAAGVGAIGGGIGGYSSAASAANAASTAASAPTVVANTAGTVGSAATGSAASVGTAAATGATAGLVGTATAPVAATSMSGTLLNGIRQIVGNVGSQTLNRLGAAVINAAVNGESMGRLDGLVAQQRAELEALKARDLAAYNQRINTAQEILNNANQMDPAWRARVAMADVAGTEANQHRQAMRDIAVRQGGSLDQGQRKAYERGAALHTARSKALAYNQNYNQAEGVQNQMLAGAAQLFGPDTAGFQNWNADTELLAAQERARREASQSTWGGIAAGLFEPDHRQATSPDPTSNGNDNNSGFFGGLFHPFGSNG